MHADKIEHRKARSEKVRYFCMNSSIVFEVSKADCF